MAAPETFTRAVQGSQMNMIVGPTTYPIGEIQNFSGLSSPVNEINIGDWGDTEVMTRPGRKSLGNGTFDIMLNPDNTTQRKIYEVRNTGETVSFEIIAPEGTIRTREFDGMVVQFGEDAADNSIYMGHITIAVTTDEVRS